MKRLKHQGLLSILLLTLPFLVFCQSNPLILNDWNNRYNFDSLNPEYFEAYTDNIIDLSNQLIVSYFTEPLPKLTPESTIYAFDSLLSIQYSDIVELLYDLHPDSVIRNTCIKEMIRLDSLKLSVFQNENIYNRLKAFANSDGASKIHPKHQKILVDYIKSFEHNGVNLSEKNKKDFIETSKQLNIKEQNFLDNIHSIRDTIWTTKEKIEGVGNDYLKSHTYNDSLFYIALPGIDYFNVMSNAVQSEIRKKTFYKNRYISYDANYELLQEIIDLRQKLAKMEGFKNYSDYVLQNNIINTSDELEEFIDNMSLRIHSYLEKEKSHVIAINNNSPIHAWDFRYVRKVERENMGYDEWKFMQFLPFEIVFDGLKDITSKVYGIEYKKVINPSVWNEDVELYEIMRNDTVIGSLYFDLYYREGKPKVGASLYSIIAPRKMSKQDRNAQMALVCSFPRDAHMLMPTMLVSLFAHEWGHAMQRLFSEEDINTVGFNPEFTEIPSSFMETIIWEPEFSPFITKHIQTEAPISEDLAEQLKHKVLLENLDILIYYLEISSWDYYLHAGLKKHADYQRLCSPIWSSIYPYPNPDTSKHPMPSNELLGLSDCASQNYGYILSKIYAIDLLFQFQKEGMQNPETWNRYRETILAPGNMETPRSMLYNFLGRSPGSDAFYKYFGLEK